MTTQLQELIAELEALSKVWPFTKETFGRARVAMKKAAEELAALQAKAEEK